MRIAALALLLAGCVAAPTGKWEKDGASAADFSQDKRACEFEAKKATAGSTFARQAYYWEIVDSCLEARGYQYNRSPQNS